MTSAPDWDASKPLKDERHELFAQELAKGSKGVAAAIRAGFKDGPGIRTAAHRLLTKADICARRDWLMENAARRTTITLAEGTEALLRIAGKAEKIANPAGLAVASQTIHRAMEAHGLIVKQIEHAYVHRIPDDQLDTVLAEIDRELARRAREAGASAPDDETEPVQTLQ